MKNKLSQKLFTLTLLSILLISISYTCMMPSAAASEPTASQKSLNILQEVFGLKLDKYNITTQEDTTSFPWLGNTVQENIYCTLTSAECKFRLIFTFVDGNLLNMCVFENQGVSELKQATNNLESAQAFLNNYQKYNTNPLFGELKASLNNVEINKNYTKTVGDKILEITVYEGVETVFMWYYSVNGATAPYTKLVSLSFNDGYLTAFNDKWNLYSIGNTEVTLSKETAITIALETAKNHNWTMQLGEDVFDPTRFNPQQSVSWVSLNFDGSLEADNPRSENILELYPVWRVGIVFNEVFGELYGAEVDIWADTQTIRSVHEEHSALAANWFKNNTPHEDQTIPPEPVVSSLSVVPGQIAFMCILMGLSGMFMIILLKKRLLTGLPHFKRFSAKVLSVLFGSLLLLLIQPLH